MNTFSLDPFYNRNGRIMQGMSESLKHEPPAWGRRRHHHHPEGRAVGWRQIHQGMVGLGDQASDLAQIQTIANDTQTKHRAALDELANIRDQKERVNFTDRRITSLRVPFLEAAMGVLGLSLSGGDFAKLDRTNPAHAIIIAVRDDIDDTVRLVQLGKANEAVMKEVAALRADPLQRWASGLGPGFPKIGIDLPWYVWAGAAGLGLLLLYNMFGKK